MNSQQHVDAAPRFSHLFVIGAAHCGSTLLGRLLNGHPRILCVGEMMRMDLALEKGLVCGCGEPIRECSFWTERLGWIQEASGLNYKKFRPDLYSRLSESTGAEITVDLSKSLVWRSSRGRNPWKGDRIGTILIVRDSRGVLAAPARAGKSLGKLIRNHLKWMSRLERHTTKLGERGLVIFYEDLCSHPARVMQQVCAFLGIQFEAAMLGIADQAHHFIHSSTSGYLKGGNEIRLDERWRRELDDVRVAEIEAMMRKLPLLRDRYLGDG